jgi:hypothetical protein
LPSRRREKSFDTLAFFDMLRYSGRTDLLMTNGEYHHPVRIFCYVIVFP